VKIILKNHECIKDHMRCSAPLRWTRVNEKPCWCYVWNGKVINIVERKFKKKKHTHMCTYKHTRTHKVPLSIMTIQEMQKSLWRCDP
jgi:hypothetical protein